MTRAGAGRTRTLARSGAAGVLVGLLVMTFVVACGDDGAAPSTSTAAAPGTGAEASASLAAFGEVGLTVQPRDGSVVRSCLLAARTADERARGLMGVTDPGLDGHDGMAFVYDEDTDGAFWMRDTPMPLSVAFVDAAGALVSTTDMAPCADSPNCPNYHPAGLYRLAVEVPEGGLAALGIAGGARITLAAAC